MLRYFFVAIFACGVAYGDPSSPGRLAVWSPQYGASDIRPQYQTRDTNVRAISSMLDDKSDSKEALVIFHHVDDTFDLINAASNIYRRAVDAFVATTIYRTSNEDDVLALKSANANTLVMSFPDFLAAATSKVLNNNQLDVLLVTLTANDDISQIANIPFDNAASIVFAAYERPSGAAPTDRAEYVSRRLASSGTTNPEGTEFSIYYENTYLYLTPDIFTGLMTMLFGSFVLYTGYGCLGAIQGPSTFANKLPALGKEG